MGFARCHGAQDMAVCAQGGNPAEKLHHWAALPCAAPDMDLPQSPTGIQGLDELTGGGLPSGGRTLVCGGAGCGKTLLSLEFRVDGTLRCGEPGGFMAFEETAADLAQNVASLGFDLDDLVARRLLVIDPVRAERSEVEASGDCDLEGLFGSLDHAIRSIGAKRVVLDHRVVDMASSRRLRVVKYRGSSHGSNESPSQVVRKQTELASQRAAMAAQIVAVRAEFAALAAAALALIDQARVSEARRGLDRDEMAHSRRVGPP